MLTLTRKKKPSPPPESEQAPDEQTTARVQQWTGGSALASKGATALILLGLATGPAALALAASGDEQAAPAPASEGTTQSEPGDALIAGEAGAEVVRAWLTATRRDPTALEQLVPGADTSNLTDSPPDTRDLRVAQAQPTQDGTWNVLVGVDLAEATEESESDEPETTWLRRYFQVPVLLDADGGTAAALTLPTPVATPLRSLTEDLLPYTSRVSEDDLSRAVSDFLGAHLTGEGDITRYTSPGTRIDPITPAPYTAAALTHLVATDDPPDASAGATVEVLATAELTRDDQFMATAQYALQLTARAGRWEVSAVRETPLTDSTARPATEEPTEATTTTGGEQQ